MEIIPPRIFGAIPGILWKKFSFFWTCRNCSWNFLKNLRRNSRVFTKGLLTTELEEIVRYFLLERLLFWTYSLKTPRMSFIRFLLEIYFLVNFLTLTLECRIPSYINQYLQTQVFVKQISWNLRKQMLSISKSCFVTKQHALSWKYLRFL